MKRQATPEYRQGYEIGWRYSQRPTATLDHVDDRWGNDPRYEAILDGYLDYAAGRDKWHFLNHDPETCTH